jgi:hypothetical protein
MFNTKHHDQVVKHSCFVFGMSSVQISDGRPAILTDYFVTFLSPPRHVLGLYFKSDYNHFHILSNIVFINHLVIWCYIFWVIDSNDLPLAINDLSIPILFADDTSILVTNLNPDILDSKLNAVFQIINTLFTSNLLSINLSKTHCMQFKTKKTL